MEDTYYLIAYVLSSLFEYYIISKFMNIFLGKCTVKKEFLITAFAFRFILGTVQYTFLPFVPLNLFVGILTMFVITLCYGGSFINKTVTVIIVNVCLFTSEVIVAGLLLLGHINIILDLDTHNGNALSYIGMAVVLWILYEIISVFKNINTQIVLPRFFEIIIAALGGIIFSMETVIFLQKNIDVSTKFLSVICMLIILFLVIYLYDAISQSYMNQMQAEIIEREKNYYLKQAELLEKKENEATDIRHDINNHLYVIGTMVEDSNEEVKNYIEHILKKIKKTRMYCDTGNLALDSIINYKLTIAAEHNIQVLSEIMIPCIFDEGAEELVTILGNLLDNAIEASEDVEDKYIHLRIVYKSSSLFIYIKNKYNGILNLEDGELQTKKKDKNFHGIGLKSVKSAVEFHRGFTDIEYDEKIFSVKIMVYLKGK